MGTPLYVKTPSSQSPSPNQLVGTQLPLQSATSPAGQPPAAAHVIVRSAQEAIEPHGQASTSTRNCPVNVAVQLTIEEGAQPSSL